MCLGGRCVCVCVCARVRVCVCQWRAEGGQGGHGPRAQALEGAPAQLLGANFKSRGEFQPSKSSIYAYMLWAPRSLCIRGSFLSFSCRRFLFFFFFFFFFGFGCFLLTIFFC